MGVPIRYNLRNLLVRWASTALTVICVGLVIAVFVVVMALGSGLAETLRSAGREDNWLVLRQSADAEIARALSQQQMHGSLPLQLQRQVPVEFERRRQQDRRRDGFAQRVANRFGIFAMFEQRLPRRVQVNEMPAYGEMLEYEAVQSVGVGFRGVGHKIS